VIVEERFQGPPQAANGGWVVGLLAGSLAPGAAIEVTLRRPVPLGVGLTVEPCEGGADLVAGGEVLAQARAAGEVEVGSVPRVGLEAARAAAVPAGLVREHPFPGCFGCGPERDPAEAVALHPGPVDGAAGVLAAAWRPGPGLPHEPGGALAAGTVWAALDCASGAAAVPPGLPPHVLGRLHGRLAAPVRVGEEVAVVAWPLGEEGRKRWGASAILGGGGEVRGVARATWIALRR
jgi:hypothetical protein